MKKVLVLIIAILLTNSIVCSEELTATACFYIGFKEAAEAFDKGDASAFVQGYGVPSPAKAKASPCWTDEMSKKSMGYVAGYQAVYFGGSHKSSKYTA